MGGITEMPPVAAPSVHHPREGESSEIQDLYKLFLLEQAPALVGPNRESVPIPESLFHILRQVIGYLRQGKGVSVIPVMEELTTQRAANMLGVSRPFLIGLLEQGVIAHHKAGTHRRVYLKDLLDYTANRDTEKRKTLAAMAKRSMEEGDYDQVYSSDNGE